MNPEAAQIRAVKIEGLYRFFCTHATWAIENGMMMRDGKTYP